MRPSLEEQLGPERLRSCLLPLDSRVLCAWQLCHSTFLTGDVHCGDVSVRFSLVWRSPFPSSQCLVLPPSPGLALLSLDDLLDVL